jgi:cysteine desulfurase
MTVYLDHNATSPLRSQAREAMVRAYDAGGNPSSVHGPGRAARAIVETARAAIAKHFVTRAEDVVFTSGGTEANNLVIASARAAGAKRLIISAIEHDAVRDAATASGIQVEILPVTPDGVADIVWLENRLAGWDRDADGTPFVALMAANNETGVVQPVEAAGRLVREAEGLFHVDAVQMAGKIAFDFAGSLAHYAALSAHKCGGPQGVGALLLACDAPLSRQMHGGGQETGRRSGTENVAGIAGFAAALEAVEADDAARMAALRDALQLRLESLEGVRIWGAGADRLPNTLCLSAEGWAAEIQVIAMDLAGFAISAGSACSSGKVKKSRVLEAMGASEAQAASAIRISFGWTSTQDDLDRFADAWIREYARIRPRLAATG